VAPAVAIAILGLALLARATVSAPDTLSGGRGAGVAVGFGLLALACLTGPRRFPVACGFALVFAVYGGLSASFAAEDLVESARPVEVLRGALADVGLVSPGPAQGHDRDLIGAFMAALRQTVVAGLAVTGAALAAEALGGGLRLTIPRLRPIDVERLGRLLVALGFVGIALALARFLFLKLPQTGLSGGVKSFWDGGAYLLLLGHASLPGAGLWLGALVRQKAGRRAYAAPVHALSAFILLLVPTGQRTFALEAGLVLLLAAATAGLVHRRQLALIAVAMLVLLGVTQAARDELRETDGITASGVMTRLAPNRLGDLYRNQFGSFRWTVEVERYRDALRIDRPLLGVALKPVPGQLYPDKPSVFAEQFTRQLHPEAAAADVNFATPLVAEAGFALGWPGIVGAHLLLGVFVGLGVTVVRQRLDLALHVASLMALGWTGFVFIRGDVGNAAFVAAGWIVPVGIVFVLLSRWAQKSSVRRVVVDALQVPVQFSGVGTDVMAIGEGLSEVSPQFEVVLRCPADVRDLLEPCFPEGTLVECPIPSSQPRSRRLFAQQVIGPIRDARDTLVVCPGDQAPLWGRAPILLVANDVRRLVRPQDNSSRGDTLFYRLVEPLSVRRADIVLTLSNFSREEIQRAVRPWRPVRVVQPHPAPAVSKAPVEPGGHVLLVGALRPYKGVDTALEAMVAADVAVPPLLVVGSDEDQRSLLEQRCRELGVETRVEFLGWIESERLDALYRDSFAVVSPSLYEGYGLPVAEGLAHGVPVVASDIPPHREVAGDAALLFSPGDASAMAAALSRLAADQGEWRVRASGALERSRYLATLEPHWGRAVKNAALTVFDPPDDTAIRTRVSPLSA